MRESDTHPGPSHSGPGRIDQDAQEDVQDRARRAYADVLGALREVGYTHVTLLLIRDVHEELLRGIPQRDILGRTIARSLQERLGR